MLAALLAASSVALIQLAQRLAAVPKATHCYYWYAILAIAAFAAIEGWGFKPGIPVDALLPPGP
jgi:hypothetical protein